MDVVLNKKQVEVRFFPEYKCLEWEWKEPTTQKNFKKLLEKIYNLFKKNNCDKFTQNMMKMGVVSDDVMQYINMEWMPRMVQAGLKYISLVMPKSAAADYSVDKIRDKVDDQREQKGVEEAIFESIEEARAWIASR